MKKDLYLKDVSLFLYKKIKALQNCINCIIYSYTVDTIYITVKSIRSKYIKDK